MNLRLVALATVLAALGACNPFGGTPIDMANPPHTKAGLWAETGVFHGQPRAPFSFCDPGARDLSAEGPVLQPVAGGADGRRGDRLPRGVRRCGRDHPQ